MPSPHGATTAPAYPDGILRAEADVSIIETLARIGDSDEALLEANDFLRRRPDSERRAEIALLGGDLYLARGDCRHVLAAYQITLGASRPRDAVEAATFQRAACMVHLGDAGGADATRAYLRAYPNGKFRGEATALVAAVRASAVGTPRRDGSRAGGAPLASRWRLPPDAGARLFLGPDAGLPRNGRNQRRRKRRSRSQRRLDGGRTLFWQPGLGRWTRLPGDIPRGRGGALSLLGDDRRRRSAEGRTTAS